MEATSANQLRLETLSQQLAYHRGIPEFSELVLACRHHLALTVLVGTAVSTILIGITWFCTVAPYTAASVVRVRQHQDVVFAPQSSRADDVTFVRSQEQIVLSSQVLAAALRDQQLTAFKRLIPANDAAVWLRDLLQVDVSSGAEVMSIAAAHPSPELSQALSDSVTRAYLTEIGERTSSDRQRRQAELEKAARLADVELDELWTHLNSVASKVGSDSSQSLTLRDELQLQSYRDYAQQLRAAQLRGTELQGQLVAEQQKLVNERDAVDQTTSRLLHSHPNVVTAQEQISKIDLQIQQLREVVSSDEAPRLKRLLNDRQQYRADFDKLLNNLERQLQEQIRVQIENRSEISLTSLKKQIELNHAEKEFLRTRMVEIDTAVVRTDEKNGIQLEMARHAVDRQTRLADGLWQSLEEFKIESQSQPRVTLIEPASLPVQANHNRQIKMAAAAAIASWLTVILCIGYFEWSGCRVRNSDDVVSHSMNPVYGLSCLSRRAMASDQSNPTNGSVELAARLMLSPNCDKEFQSVLVTSASAREPKHLVSLDLAIAFKVFQRRTLLIDGDGTGFLTRLLAAEHRPGLRQLGQDWRNYQDFIVPSMDENLDFFSLGPSHGGASWIEPKGFQLMMNCLRAKYQAIVVNGPSISSAVESLLLASQLDQMVIAVFGGVSRWNQLALSEQVARRTGIAVLGSVLHSGKTAVSLKLRCDLQGTPNQGVEKEQAIESSVEENLSEIHRELKRAAVHPNLMIKAPITNREFTS